LSSRASIRWAPETWRSSTTSQDHGDLSGTPPILQAMNYPRRQQRRRLARAATVGAGALGLVALALLSAPLVPPALTVALLAGAGGLGLRARHWARLAARSQVGARSEEQVHKVLNRLAGDGWQIRHSLNWQGPGDIDSIACAPTGIAAVIETKTLRYEPRHLELVVEQATWLARRRKRMCPRGAVPVLCVARAHGVEHLAENGALIVSIDRLPAALRRIAAQP